MTANLITIRCRQLIMKEFLSNYAYELKDKNILFHKADIILVVLIVAECFIILHVFTK